MSSDDKLKDDIYTKTFDVEFDLNTRLEDIGLSKLLENIKLSRVVRAIKMNKLLVRNISRIVKLLNLKNCILKSNNYHICAWFLIILYVEVSLDTNIDDEMDWFNMKTMLCLESICKRFDPTEKYKPKGMPDTDDENLSFNTELKYVMQIVPRCLVIFYKKKLTTTYMDNCILDAQDTPWLINIIRERKKNWHNDICSKRYQYDSISTNFPGIESIIWYFCYRLGVEGVTYACEYMDPDRMYSVTDNDSVANKESNT